MLPRQANRLPRYQASQKSISTTAVHDSSYARIVKNILVRAELKFRPIKCHAFQYLRPAQISKIVHQGMQTIITVYVIIVLRYYPV